MVDPKSRGLRNVFLYLRPGEGENHSLRVHPDHLKQAKKPVKWTVDKRGFTPHAILLQTNQTLLLTHGDEVSFNIKLDLFRNGSTGVITPPTATAKYQFTRTESLPGSAICNIYPWISGYLLVLDHPYAAITDKQGKFTIKNLPVGKHVFKFWQEKTGYVELPEIRLSDSDLEGDRKRGRLIIDIKPGDNDLGEIKIDPAVFE